jgi:hypothetical protein
MLHRVARRSRQATAVQSGIVSEQDDKTSAPLDIQDVDPPAFPDRFGRDVFYTVLDNLDGMKMCSSKVAKLHTDMVIDQVVIRLNIKIIVLHARKLATADGIQQFSGHRSPHETWCNPNPVPLN